MVFCIEASRCLIVTIIPPISLGPYALTTSMVSYGRSLANVQNYRDGDGHGAMIYFGLFVLPILDIPFKFRFANWHWQF